MTSTLIKFPIVIEVARKFYEDHEERDCGVTDIVVKRNTHTIKLQLDEEGWSDLMSDAKHYGYGGMDFDDFNMTPEDRALIRSARAVFTKMTKAGA